MPLTSASDSTICPICAARATKTILKGHGTNLAAANIGPSRNRISPGQILQCARCGFAFQTHRNGDAELAVAYSKAPSEAYDREEPGRVQTARVRLKAVHRQLSGGRLLDVGCASGTFLDLAKSGGWSITGIEPSISHCQSAGRRLGETAEIFLGTLQEAHLPPGSFDAITVWDVLEHVREPLSFLGLCADLLRTGGYLFVTVPDISSTAARVMGTKWPLLLPEHLGYFTRKSLRLCGEQTGLTVREFKRLSPRFSIGYLALRLRQHRVFMADLFGSITRRLRADRLVVPVPTGDIFCAFQKLARRASQNPDFHRYERL